MTRRHAREGGAPSTWLLDSIATALEYRIIRRSLSSGGALRRPVADDDGCAWTTPRDRHHFDASQMYDRAGRNIAWPNFA
jgi:hypothetical protein